MTFVPDHEKTASLAGDADRLGATYEDDETTLAPHRYEPHLFGAHDGYSVGGYFTTIDPDTMQYLHATSF